MGLKIVFLEGKLYINNPLQKVNLNKLILEEDFYKHPKISEEFEEDNNIQLWGNKDYFSKVPRLTNWIEEEKVHIDSIPTVQQVDDKPMLLMMGTSMAMGTTMILSIANTLEKSLNGESTIRNTITSLIASGAMVVAMLLMPIFNRGYEKKKKREYEEKRQWRYRKYLSIKQKTIDEIRDRQKALLESNFLTTDECISLILNKDTRLWERNINDKDFMTVRLGDGSVHIKADISYPAERFTMYDDDLEDVLMEMEKKSALIENSPVTMSFCKKNVVSFISQDNEKLIKYIKNLIIQLITFHSYEELKIVFLLKNETSYLWNFARNLPHTWDDYRKFRYFSTDMEEAKNVIKNLGNVFQIRNTITKNNDKRQIHMPFYLIITDNYSEIEGISGLEEIINSEKNLGFSVACLGKNLTDLPNECKTFINIGNDVSDVNEVDIEESEKIDVKGEFKIDSGEHHSLDGVIRTLANIPIRFSNNLSINVKDKYTFLEMYDVGMIEQLNVLDRWNKNNTSVSLRAPIGIDTNGSKIMLDIHENAHGPHGLIAGTTGSGKSEFIITYILSLAVNFRPDDVNFILIDYKGGGLAGAFKKNNVKLPHLIGTITNIDKVGLQRSLVSIQSELRRRQILFNEARDNTDGGTIDIYKYQKLYHEGTVKEPIPHLLIVCDEFAELKQQQPEFMDELMSVSRIGRSLGVHLILATQKPSGIVNEQIRSNSKFAICLKVQDRSDSNDVIKHPDAANLKTAGTFYLNVGNDEYYTLGQSGWSGAQYIPSNIVEKKIDNSIEFISNTGNVIKSINDKNVISNNSNGDQLTYIVKYLDKLAEFENIETKPLWLDSIPEKIFISDLRKKYNITEDKNVIAPIIGEFDDPYNQRQGIVRYNLLKSGNSIIYGSADSGKENLISTLIYDIMNNYSTSKVETYILDFGSEAFKIFKNSPTVGDVITASDTEKLERFFDIIWAKFTERKNILSSYNGDYDLYLKTSGKTMPILFVVINSYEVFVEMTENKYEDIITSLTRECIKYGIVFCVTTTAYHDMRFRLSQNFKNKIALRLNKEDDLFNIFENVGKKRASNLFGRGLIRLEDDDEIYEFQTARICEPEKYNEIIKSKIDELKDKKVKEVSSIPVMPTKVTFNMLKDKIKTLKNIPLGLNEKDLSVNIYNFKKDLITLVIGRNLENVSEYIYNIIEEVKKLEINIVVFDANNIEIDKKEEFIEKYNCFEENVLNSKVQQETLCIIIGLDKLWETIGKRDLDFNNLLKKTNENKLINFIVAENVKKIKSHEYEQWYKSFIIGDTGIFVGNGVDDQYIININTPRRELKGNCGSNFGYVIKSGNAVQIKLLEMMKEENNV